MQRSRERRARSSAVTSAGSKILVISRMRSPLRSGTAQSITRTITASSGSRSRPWRMASRSRSCEGRRPPGSTAVADHRRPAPPGRAFPGPRDRPAGARGGRPHGPGRPARPVTTAEAEVTGLPCLTSMTGVDNPSGWPALRDMGPGSLRRTTPQGVPSDRTRRRAPCSRSRCARRRPPGRDPT